jgi:hypothetical protein
MSKPGRRRRTPAERLAARAYRVAAEQNRRAVSAHQFTELILGKRLNEWVGSRT